VFAKIDNNRIFLSFDFNNYLIYKIKMIKGRKWHSLYKRWSIPMTDRNLNIVKELGFDLREIEARNLVLSKDFKTLRKEIKKKYPFLYDYQLDCTTKSIISGRLGIFDEMGLGKSVETLCAVDYLMDRGDFERAFIYSPSSIKWQWEREINKFIKKNVVIVEGTKDKRQQIYKDVSYDFYIGNYEQVLRDFYDVFELTNGQGLVLDEASWLKNPKAKRTSLIKELKPKVLLALTGTPIENKLRDAYVIGNIIQPKWMEESEFYGYCKFDERFKGKIIGYKDINLFMERLMQISIRRKREDVADFPERVILDRFIKMKESQRKLEDKVSDIIKNHGKGSGVIQLFTLLHMVEDATTLLKLSKAKSLRMLDVNSFTDASAKIDELKNMLDEVGTRKTVIFTKFRNMAKIINKLLLKNGYTSVLGMGGSDKRAVIKEFRENTQFLVATDAYSYGVDLPFGEVVINYDIRWNPARLKQRMDRCYRVTSKNKMLVINMVSNGLEEHMYSRMKGKENLADEVLDFDVRKQLLSYVFKDDQPKSI